MSDRPWWSVAIQWALWAIVMTIVMGWLGKSRFRQRRAEELGTLRHPKSTLIVGLVCFGFFAALTVFTIVTDNKTATWWTTAIFAALAAMSVPPVLDYFMAKHRVSGDGLQYRKMLGRTGFVEWISVRNVRYDFMMKWFRLETNCGEVVRVSVMLMGLPEFARALLNGAPNESMDDVTRGILLATAKGNPPSPWG